MITLCDFLSLSLIPKSSRNFGNLALPSGIYSALQIAGYSGRIGTISTSSWKAFRFQTYSRHSMHFLKPPKDQC